MSNIEASLRTELLKHVGLASAVGTRYYPDVLPQATIANPGAYLPAVVARRITTPSVASFTGARTSSPRFQMSCWAATHAAAVSVAEQLRAALLSLQASYCPLIIDERSLRDHESGLWREDIDVRVLTDGE